ncbi:MAG TPA: hypothetical protein DCX60_10535 [Phycisphaerales bacterium]|nr:hypothetical protein [Phycisphaerales bacterium]
MRRAWEVTSNDSNDGDGWMTRALSTRVVVVESDAVEDPKIGTFNVISTSTGTNAPGVASRTTSATEIDDTSRREPANILKVISFSASG